jgi:hypothetical protein
LRYWWVNHSQTAREELDGGYLWSPLREANGARSQFYDNMRIAESGDVVLSFSNGLIHHHGRVADFAVISPKPNSFDSIDNNWSASGWMLPVEWKAFATPVRPKERISELAPLLPKKYSPIHPISGNGNQKAYLAEIGAPVFEYLMRRAGLSDESFAEVGVTNGLALSNVDKSIESQISQDVTLDSTTQQQLVLARQGQGLFRSRVLELEKACRLTSIDNPSLLIASHIKPWRICETAGERLDGANGLALAPHVDRLFDRGLISFTDSGRVLVSPRLNDLDLKRLGLFEACTMGCASFSKRQAAYLEFHRTHVFLQTIQS